jgi:hypothetical protein
MILLKSIPLSLGVFWRYLIVMVVLLPAAMIVSAVFSLIPFVGGILQMVVNTFVVLVGFRVAFQAAGAYSAPVFGRLVRGAVMWGMIEGLIYTIVMVAVFIFFAGAASTLEAEFKALGPKPDFGEIVGILAGSPLILGVGAISFALMTFISTLLAAPKAATAFSAGQRAQQLPLFWGTGMGFASILLVALGGYAVMYFSGAFGQLLALVLHGVDLATSALEKGRVTWLSQSEYMWMGGAILLWIWTYCWWCAVTALAVLAEMERREARSFANRPTAPQHQVDLSELRRSRTQPRPGRPG